MHRWLKGLFLPLLVVAVWQAAPGDVQAKGPLDLVIGGSDLLPDFYYAGDAGLVPEFQLWDYVFREEVGEPPVDGCPVSAGRTHCPEQFLIDPPGDAEALLASAYDLYYDGHEGADARYVPEAAGRPAYLQLLGPVEIQYFEPGTWLQLSGMTSRWLGLALDRALFARDFESWSRYNSVRAAEVHNGTIYGWLADASYVVVEGSPYPFDFENSRQGQEVHGYDAFRLHDALYTLLEKSGRPEAWERGDNSYWISSTRQLQWDPEWVEFSVSEDGRVDEIYAYGELYEPTSVLARLLESIVIGEPTEDTLEVPSALGEPVFDETGATAEFVGTHQKSGNQTEIVLALLGVAVVASAIAAAAMSTSRHRRG